jgi:hypothetical protein
MPGSPTGAGRQRIAVRLPDRFSTTDFYDFNAPITITPPGR